MDEQPSFAALWQRMRQQGLEAIPINPVDHPDAWAKWLHWYILNGNDEPMRMMQKHQRKLVPCLDPFDPDARFEPEWVSHGDHVREGDVIAPATSDQSRAEVAVAIGRARIRRRLLFD